MVDMDNSWIDVKELTIFGYGRQASKLIDILEKDFKIVSVVDNDCKKQGIKLKNGIEIAKPDDILKLKTKIVVCAMGKNYTQMSEQLKNIGLVEDIDFMQHERFLTGWYWSVKKQVYMLKTDIFVTSFCNLRCEKCASFIPYCKENKHLKVDEIKESLDNYFRFVDYVSAMDIYGGEPMLYPDLVHLLEYIGKKYREKIGTLGIITNGLLPLSDELVRVAKKWSLRFSVSDYAMTLPMYKQKIDEFCRILEENEIIYIRNVNLIWKDLGFPNERIHIPKDFALEHRSACDMTCHNLYKNSLYFCAVSMTAEINRLTKNGRKDIFDLQRGVNEGLRQELLEFANGEIKGEYQGFCNVCRGFGVDNDKEIVAAKQCGCLKISDGKS